jgi:hypothetical protein
MHELRAVRLTLAAILLLVVVSQVRGQTVSEVTVGTASIKPGIDGQWRQGEWNSAIEYVLTGGSSTPIKATAYLRMMHDAHNLYGIIDAPSDNGATYVNANGDTSWGAVLFAFYYGAFLNPNNQTQLYTLFALNTNQTKIVNVGVYCRCPGEDPNRISSYSQAATTLSVTPHSNTNHRVWEFSLPIFPYVITTSLDQNPMIGFDVTVIDSTGNQLSLVTLAQHAELTFVSTPVPETLSGQVMLPVALITPLILLFAFRRRRAP